MQRFLVWMAVIASTATFVRADSPAYRAELVFPLRSEHNHAAGLVECANGDLLASWYRGHGERSSDDVGVYGARLRKGDPAWSADFVMVDTPGFPDCNTCMMIDPDGRLWLFWPVIIANTWESALTNYLYSGDYTADGPPKWEWQGVVYMKPEDFKDEMIKNMTEWMSKPQTAGRRRSPEQVQAYFDEMKRRLGQKIYQRMGWQGRCKPTVLPPSAKHPNGRYLLPLYTDTFSLGIMAISDDKGRTWQAGKPIFGRGAIQPSVLPKADGTLVAYMRDNGGSGHIKISESKDDGQTWGQVSLSPLPNPGAGIDGVRLANGHFCLVYNDTRRARNSLAVSISDDEGKTWKWTRHLDRHETGAFHYPCVIQGRDGTIHAIYSYSAPLPAPDNATRAAGAKKRKGGESMKHAAFNEAWVIKGDS